MKKALLTGVAALSVLSASAASAHAEWKTEFWKCHFAITVPKEDKDFPNLRTWDDGDSVGVVILAEQVPEILREIALLKKCNAFWKCVNDRDEGKVKHCYENDRRWR